MHYKYLVVLALLMLGANCVEAAASTFNLTSVHLGCMFSNLLAGTITQALPKLQIALAKGGISTREQASAFFTVVSVCSDNLSVFKQSPCNSDCSSYTGRGALMLSGLATYTTAKLALGVDYVGSPDTMTTIDNRYLVAGWYWALLGHNLFTYNAAGWNLIALAYRDDMGMTMTGSTLSNLYPTIYNCLQPDTSCSWYVTVTGDTPTKIASAKKVTLATLMSLNGWTNANAVLAAGESIKLQCS